MSEEERQAIKELTEIKELVEEDLKYDKYEATAILDQTDLKALVTVLNLVEKQQKETEELKQDNEILKLALEDSINKSVLEAKLNKLREDAEQYKKYSYNNGNKTEIYIKTLGKIELLEEVLGE